MLLVAMPGMDDPRFSRSVVYICAHSAEGAMGLVVNQAAGQVSFPAVIGQLGIEADERRVFAITPKFEGYVERLHVNVTGQAVAKGQALFEVYSPELLSALRVAVTEAPMEGGFLQEPWQQLVAAARAQDDVAIAAEYDRLFRELQALEKAHEQNKP